MATIAERTESDIDYETRFRQRKGELGADVTDAISHATVTTSMDPVSYTHLDVYKRQDHRLSEIIVHQPPGSVQGQNGGESQPVLSGIQGADTV